MLLHSFPFARVSNTELHHFFAFYFPLFKHMHTALWLRVGSFKKQHTFMTLFAYTFIGELHFPVTLVPLSPSSGTRHDSRNVVTLTRKHTHTKLGSSSLMLLLLLLLVLGGFKTKTTSWAHFRRSRPRPRSKNQPGTCGVVVLLLLLLHTLQQRLHRAMAAASSGVHRRRRRRPSQHQQLAHSSLLLQR